MTAPFPECAREKATVATRVHFLGAVFQQLARKLPAMPALPELVAQRADETLRAKLTKERHKQAQKAAKKSQPRLL